MTYEWDCFLWTADEWIISYLQQPLITSPAVKLFSIGHACELYLKAENSKITNNIDHAVGFGHNLEKLWLDSKGKSQSFMPTYELRQSILDRNLLDADDCKNLNPEDLKHFLSYQELYII